MNDINLLIIIDSVILVKIENALNNSNIPSLAQSDEVILSD
jgi:hypothetical protein